MCGNCTADLSFQNGVQASSKRTATGDKAGRKVCWGRGWVGWCDDVFVYQIHTGRMCIYTFMHMYVYMYI